MYGQRVNFKDNYYSTPMAVYI